jgi:hypothetical protein
MSIAANMLSRAYAVKHHAAPLNKIINMFIILPSNNRTSSLSILLVFLLYSTIFNDSSGIINPVYKPIIAKIINLYNISYL